MLAIILVVGYFSWHVHKNLNWDFGHAKKVSKMIQEVVHSNCLRH